MIVKTAHVKSADYADFFNTVNNSIADMQNLGLKVEIQYQIASAKDEFSYTVFTALLIGRKKGGADNG